MAAAAAWEEELTEAELEVAAILCGLKRILRGRDRRRRRRFCREAPEIPSWGRRRLRSVLEDNKPAVAAAAVAERGDGAASPDTPLAFPESGGDDAAVVEEDFSKKARTHAEWVQEQHGVVASLSQEKAHLLKIEEYRARLQSSRSTNESLKQLHKVREKREQEQALKLRMMAQRQGTTQARANPRPAPGLGLDLNEPARAPEGEEDDAAARARAAAAEEWCRQGQLRAALQKAAVAAVARRRRLEILRAKVASPLVSSRTRRAG
ncbi:uncharacterized protein LOC133918250 isoform X2 [Phragmites australis]|uniref:uncharacterized protein LOC133918250 isoform X2 n=1 Tax=Phragmites australis TaxID=29695 RepID=UPI002D786D04|nr:uncharacterized protein LOC133918250 isoform X2 [Phragmites australis]